MFAKYKWSSTHHLVKQNFMGYQPPSPISNDGWGYHQETSNSGHSNSWSYASEPQDEKENHMGYFFPPQNNASHDSNGGWEGNPSAPYDNHPKISSLDHTSTESPFQNSPPTQTSMNHSRLSELESKFEKYAKEAQISEKRQEAFFKNMNEEVEKIRRSLEPLSKKNEGQLMDIKEEVEEQESEEVIPNSSEAEKYIKEEFMEPPIQKALDEYKTPTITQPPKLGFKEVKAIDKSTKKRIVTKTPRTTFMRRSTANNPPPDPASKINQANFTRKLAEERPRQGALAETSPPLKSFLLTNWKKRKKVKNR
ncbi:hypothetical protein AHAS_Ahas15G0193600 [Arachis hypogaea]